jgi:hypothetical protein
MAVIKTTRNFVCAYEPVADDRFVETWLRGEPLRYRLLTQPIAKYDEAVRFAVSIADQMASPIDVLPITAGEYINHLRRG